MTISMRLAVCAIALMLAGCSSGVAVNDDIQLRPTSAQLKPSPVKVARDADACHVRRAAIRSASLPASLRSLEQAEAVLSKGDTYVGASMALADAIVDGQLILCGRSGEIRSEYANRCSGI